MSNMQQYAVACSALPFLTKAFIQPAVLYSPLHPSKVALTFAYIFIPHAPQKSLALAKLGFRISMALKQGRCAEGS